MVSHEFTNCRNALIESRVNSTDAAGTTTTKRKRKASAVQVAVPPTKDTVRLLRNAAAKTLASNPGGFFA